MRLDAEKYKFMDKNDFRVLSALEIASRNHQTVPTSMLSSLTQINPSGIESICKTLCHYRLIRRDDTPCGTVKGNKRKGTSKSGGYILCYGGFDYLALHALTSRSVIDGVGSRMGVGKESDIHSVSCLDPLIPGAILKIHRLGRISFRNVKNKRDYHGHRSYASWMHLSRLAATKEYAFLKALHEHGFPVPTPVDQNRHIIVMHRIDGVPLYQINDLEDPLSLYDALMNLILKFAQYGLIHGDFNEFNIILREKDCKPIVIDFPQMVSVSHSDAKLYFERDVDCIRRWFKKKFIFESEDYPQFDRDVLSSEQRKIIDLDVILKTSGFTHNANNTFQKYIHDRGESDEDDHSDEQDLSSSESENHHPDSDNEHSNHLYSDEEILQ